MHENSALFPSTSEEANFNNWLKTIISGMTDTDQMEAGYNFGRIGSHSTKKGGTTYASSLPGFCSVIAAWLRAGWSLGCVLPAYIHATDGGDQSVGRLLSGLDPSTADLSILPPRFKNADIQSIKWEELLVDFAKYPQDFKIVVPCLIASVVHHSEYLCKSLPSTHPIFVSRFWRNGAQITLRAQVLPPVQMRCDVTGMVASGVAPITQIYHKIDTKKVSTQIDTQIYHKKVSTNLDTFPVQHWPRTRNISPRQRLRSRRLTVSFDRLILTTGSYLSQNEMQYGSKQWKV
jgi:hypothetical protein